MLLQKNPPKMNTVKDSAYVYHISEVPTQINVITINSRVELRPIEGDEWKVECMDKEKLYHTVELVDGLLTVKQIDTRAWYEHIGILNGLQNMTVTVYLPEQVYENLNIHSTSGSIKVGKEFVFSNVSLQNTSGSTSCASRVTSALDVKATSGSITVSGSVGGNLNAQNTSGSITISGSVGGDLIAKNTSGSITISGGVDGKLDVTNGSGRIEVKNATPTSATIQNTSGSIDLLNVVCQGNCEIVNTSGSIEFEHCDALSFDLRTTSGGIRGSILSAKTFDCRSISGGVHVPNNGNGGNFLARSGSGGIRVEVVPPAK